MNPAILALVTLLSALAIALASADNLFKGHSWLVPYLYGACLVLLAFAALNAFVISKREQKEAAILPLRPALVQENKQIVTLSPTQNVNVYAGATKESTEIDEVDIAILDILKGRPNGYYAVPEVAKPANLSVPEVWRRVLRLERLGRVVRGTLEIESGAVWRINNLQL